MMTGPVRAERNTAIYLAASSGLDNTERNVRDMDNTTLTRKIKRKPKRISKSRRIYVKPWLRISHIITRNGVVTLRGPVESEAESIKLQTFATKTCGGV